jgi:hypothetical protein
MSEIKPWIGFITVMAVDHQDKVVKANTGLGDDPASEFLHQALGMPKEVEVRQGITAGVVVATGEGVPDLAPGAKVYYAERSAIEIGEVKLVHTNYVVA